VSGVRRVAGTDGLVALLDAGDPLEQVLGDAQTIAVVDGAADLSADSVLADLRALAAVGRAGRRTIAVLGPVVGADWEEHDRIGRIVVRLDIRALIVVGEGARLLGVAAGLEGSFDGESEFVADEASAYDVLRVRMRAGDVVLVKLPAPDTAALLARLEVPAP
jgi:UDP-N-acetylmuramoyl-tripeptide--D-alanyl-D-alanine ligase